MSIPSHTNSIKSLFGHYFVQSIQILKNGQMTVQ